jgi:hypothetical protein
MHAAFDFGLYDVPINGVGEMRAGPEHPPPAYARIAGSGTLDDG